VVPLISSHAHNHGNSLLKIGYLKDNPFVAFQHGSDNSLQYLGAAVKHTEIAKQADEDQYVSITLKTLNLPSKLSLYYELSGLGIESNDFEPSQLSGFTSIDEQGEIRLKVQIKGDSITEGEETVDIRIYLDEKSKFYLGGFLF